MAPYRVWLRRRQLTHWSPNLRDFFHFVLVLDSKPECYRALGVVSRRRRPRPPLAPAPVPPPPDPAAQLLLRLQVHETWRALGNFKDYISTPKPNAYQSLHTTVLGPKAQQIDVFLRTRQMDEVAQEGVVAYWRAQEHSGGAQLADGEIDGRWLDVLRGISSAADSADDFIEAARMELFPDQVFCFTPRGDLIQLPRGSTPLDFAYAVHTSIGTRCRYARVNGRLQSIHAELRTGDLVEIVCEPGAEPAAEWEEKVVSGKARAEIRRFHNAKRRRELLGRGRLLLGRALDALSGGMLAIRHADADGDGHADGGASYPRGGAAVTASAATAPAAARGGVGAAGGGGDAPRVLSDLRVLRIARALSPSAAEAKELATADDVFALIAARSLDAPALAAALADGAADEDEEDEEAVEAAEAEAEAEEAEEKAEAEADAEARGRAPLPPLPWDNDRPLAPPSRPLDSSAPPPPAGAPPPVTAAGPAVGEQEEVEVLDFSPTKDAQMAMHLSRCCRPLPGDDVIGLVPRDGPAAALVVHRASCPACQPKPNERRVAVRWGEPWRRAEHRATARLSLQLLDPRLGFAQVAAALAELDGTISSFRISRRVEGVAFATLEVEVRDLAHLDEALAALGALAGVRNVRRA